MTTHFKANRHDFSITDPSASHKMGFVVDRKDGFHYQELDGKALVDLYASDSPTQSNTNPEEELLLGQGPDWRAGFGKEYWNSSDPTRYFSSIGCDLRFVSGAIAGPTPQTHSFPTVSAVPTVQNGGMDTDTYWDHSEANVSWGADSGRTGGGIALSGSGEKNTWQYIEGWTPGVQYTVTGWCKGADSSNKVRVQVADGTQTISSTYNETSSWVEKTAQITVASTAEYLKINFNASCAGGDACCVDDASIAMDSAAGAVAYTGVIRAHAEYNDDIYYSLDKKILRFDDSTGASVLIWQFAANITGLEVFQVSGVDYLFVALGTATAYEYLRASTYYSAGFTTSTATDKYFTYFKWVHTTADTLYGAVEDDKSNSIRSTVNPLNDGTAWSDQTIVGDAASAIQGQLEDEGALYIPKEDTIYYLDSSGNVQSDLAPELVALKCSTSNQNADVWLGNIYTQAGTQALLEIGTSNTWRTPAEYTTNNSDFNGRVQALAHDDQWLYAILDNSTKVEVVAGRLETIDGTSTWVWHPIAEITLDGCQAAWVSSVYKKRLWIASTLSTDSLYFIDLYTGYGDVTSDANRVFKTDAYFITPWLHGDFKTDQKALIKMTATLGHSYDVDVYWECWYQTLGGTWTDMGDLKGSATSMTAELFRTTSTTSTMFRFMFVAKTDTTNVTPELLTYVAKLILYPDPKRIIFTRVKVGRGVLDKDGNQFKDKYTLQKNCLENIRNATWPITMTDLDGATKYVKLLPLPRNIPYREVVSKEKNEVTEWAYNLLLLEVPLS